MRIWEIEVENLCRVHLLGEHRELHAIWTILTTDKKGYRNHPETKRWVGKLAALFRRHEEQVKELERRNYNHKSPLDKKLARGKAIQDEFINTYEEQRIILRDKGCICFLIEKKID